MTAYPFELPKPLDYLLLQDFRGLKVNLWEKLSGLYHPKKVEHLPTLLLP